MLVTVVIKILGTVLGVTEIIMCCTRFPIDIPLAYLPHLYPACTHSEFLLYRAMLPGLRPRKLLETECHTTRRQGFEPVTVNHF